MRGLGDLRIAEQRQNRMIERRGGNFDLAMRREFAIDRQNALQRLALPRFQQRLIRAAIVAALAHQLAKIRVARQQVFVKPRQLV